MMAIGSSHSRYSQTTYFILIHDGTLLRVLLSGMLVAMLHTCSWL